MKIITRSFVFLGIAVVNFNCSDPTIACFTYAPNYIEVDKEVMFSASCSEMTSMYEWTFGDGTDTLTSEEYVTHKYSAPGIYKVTLQAIRKDYNGFVRKGNTIQNQSIRVN